jgi:hypothetical protein
MTRPRTARREKPETRLQATIVKGLQAAGRIVVRINSGSARVRRGYMHGAPKGWPDLYVLGWGWLECKTATGKLTIDQDNAHAHIIGAGERVATVRTVAEALRAVMGGSNG